MTFGDWIEIMQSFAMIALGASVIYAAKTQEINNRRLARLERDAGIYDEPNSRVRRADR